MHYVFPLHLVPCNLKLHMKQSWNAPPCVRNLVTCAMQRILQHLFQHLHIQLNPFFYFINIYEFICRMASCRITRSYL